QLHRDVAAPVDLTGLEHLDDVGVVQLTAQVRLARELRDAVGVTREPWEQPLERDDLPLQRALDGVGAEHLCHAAPSEEGLQLVVTEQLRSGQWRRHSALRQRGRAPAFWV